MIGSSLLANEPSIHRIGVSNAGDCQAVRVDDAYLLHTAQLLPTVDINDAKAQTLNLLEQLDAILEPIKSAPSDVVKLNVYVNNIDAQKEFAAQLRRWSPNATPAVAYVVSKLPNKSALVACDAVAVARQVKDIPVKSDREPMQTAILPPGDVLYVSGQAEAGSLAEATAATLTSLDRTLNHHQLSKDYIAQVKCFLQPMAQAKIVNREIAKFFGDMPIPPVVHVEWISGSRPIEIEVLAWAPRSKTKSSVSYSTPPWMKSSPVFSRVARIHGDQRIYISGLYSKATGDGSAQVESIFEQLKAILSDAGSDLRHMAKATYYVSDNDPSTALNRLRPKFYDPNRPPAASKAKVHGVAMSGRGISIDMIAAPTSKTP